MRALMPLLPTKSSKNPQRKNANGADLSGVASWASVSTPTLIVDVEIDAHQCWIFE
jgi:hypothetical protein